MKALTTTLRRMTVIIITLLVMPCGIMAQDTDDSGQSYRFSKEELTQMLAPIALYPDALTAQILMASTYPLEVVEADRWIKKNRQLKGDDLDSALQSKDWDPSVKSICHFPDLLNSMSEKLDQTRKLGDAFLEQEEEVMATIQELRGKAIAQGNLKTTGEQKVIVEDEIVTIEPVNPEVIYVPVYDPAYVYGPWWYPAYPPFYWYYPAGYYGGIYIGFSPGIYFGFNAFTWAWFDWSYRRVHLDLTRTRYFNRYYDRRGATGTVWTHSPEHRRGVAYRDLRTSDRFGSRVPRISSSPIPELRGYPGGRIERQGVQPSLTSPQRGVIQSAPQTPPVRRSPATVPRTSDIRREGSVAPTVQPGSKRSPAVVRDTPFSGIGRGSSERRAGERGGISNRSDGIGQRPGGFSGGQMLQRRGSGGSWGGGQERGSRR
ncbi:MAG: DUF3300 domain-containing protein [Desulfuromonadaceae bacterium]